MFFVSDFETMKTFYCEVLGLPVLEEIKGEWIVLAAGEAKINLHKTGSSYAGSSSNNSQESNVKIILEIDDNIHQLYETLLSKGVAVKKITSFEGYPYFLFMGQDPEGNVFQIIQKQ